MSLREMKTGTKMNEENAHVVLRKDVPKRRGPLGEIGNRVGTRLQVAGKLAASKPMITKPVVSKPTLNKTLVGKPTVNLKNVAAKVVTRHAIAPLKANAKPRLVVPRTTKIAADPVTSELIKDAEPTQPDARTEPEPAFSAELLDPVGPLDEDDDPTLVTIYVADIYKYLTDLENKYTIRPEYLTGQEVSKRMRSVLIDWLIEVHMQFRLLQESLYLTVAVIDRFLQDYQTIDRKSLQLVGVAAMSVACKYEEMYSPELGDYVYIADNAYTKNQILKMEGKILETLAFNFGRPLPLHFLRRFSKVGDATAPQHTMAKYFLELSLIEYSMCHLSPSIMAAASVFLSMWLLGGYDSSVWTKQLQHVSGYSLQDIKPIVHQLAVMIVNAPKCTQQATRKKFAAPKLLSISRRAELDSEEIKSLANGEGDF